MACILLNVSLKTGHLLTASWTAINPGSLPVLIVSQAQKSEISTGVEVSLLTSSNPFFL